MIETLPAEWRSALGSRLSDADIRKLDEFVFVERAQAQVFPPDEDVFAALSLTPPDQVRAVILGQAARARPGYTRRLAGGNLSGARQDEQLESIRAWNGHREDAVFVDSGVSLDPAPERVLVPSCELERVRCPKRNRLRSNAHDDTQDYTPRPGRLRPTRPREPVSTGTH